MFHLNISIFILNNGKILLSTFSYLILPRYKQLYILHLLTHSQSDTIIHSHSHQSQGQLCDHCDQLPKRSLVRGRTQGIRYWKLRSDLKDPGVSRQSSWPSPSRCSLRRARCLEDSSSISCICIVYFYTQYIHIVNHCRTHCRTGKDLSYC